MPYSSAFLIAPRAANFAPPISTIIDLPSFKADPQRHGTGQTVIALIHQQLLCIGGTQYAGEEEIRLHRLLTAREGRDAHALLANMNANDYHGFLAFPVPARQPFRLMPAAP
jgi:hypothetical protein